VSKASPASDTFTDASGVCFKDSSALAAAREAVRRFDLKI